MAPFVPYTFTPPAWLDGDAFRLRPLGPEHNDSDYAAWTSSIDHIHTTPGYEGASWPHAMTSDANRRDLEAHAADFAARKGFTYTVLAREEGGRHGLRTSANEARIRRRVRSWVGRRTPTRHRLYRGAGWLRDAWPFERVEYTARPTP
jgi:hypothetical protein